MPSVTPEMVEKARLTEQERIALFAMLQQWSRNQELQAQKVADWIEVRAASAVQDAVRDCIAIVENEPELEGPIPNYIRSLMLKQSLEDQQRGAVGATKKSIAAALREKYGVSERKGDTNGS